MANAIIIRSSNNCRGIGVEGAEGRGQWAGGRRGVGSGRTGAHQVHSFCLLVVFHLFALAKRSVYHAQVQ